MLTITTAEKAELDYKVTDQKAEVRFLEDTEETYLQLEFIPELSFDNSEYVLFPACCYNGNRFNVLKKSYPPMLTPEEAQVALPITMTDVPRLEKDGSGCIEVTTGDVSVPCIGVYLPQHKRGILLYTIQQIDGRNLGLVYEKGRLKLRYPCFREKASYRWPYMVPSSDRGICFTKDTVIEIPYRYYEFPCESMEHFYEEYFRNRKCMGLPCERPEILPFEKQAEIQKDKFNYLNWYDAGGFYGHCAKTDDPIFPWQPGWCGGAMSSYALLKIGGKLEEKRALKTLIHVFRTQRVCGFLADAADWEGNETGRGFGEKTTLSWHLVRKSADVLYFLFKHFDVLKEKRIPVDPSFEKGARKLADAFVLLWNKYGQFGQFVDLNTGDIVVGGSTAGAIACAGLCLAYRYFKDEKYLKTAEKAGEFYYTRDAQNGYTTGGPEEILQCPDSESCAGLLESMVVLYETTKESRWLERAKHAAHIFSSWVVSYNYQFPEGSEFARLNMKTVGSVFANAQNKHSAPGICTLSGDCLHKLYEYTGDLLYQELFEDVVLTVSQYMSTDRRPIYSWDVPKDASLLQDDSIRVPRERLLPGYICERVNMSDWESSRCVGGVFNGSCWCETTNLLVLAECAGLVDRNKIKFKTED